MVPCNAVELTEFETVGPEISNFVFRGGKISRLYLKAIDIRTEKSYNDKRVLPARRENGREQ